MKISEIYEKKGKPIVSFEIFPPKKTSSIHTIYETLEELKDLKPDFISVTYGAGGNTADQSTCQIASDIKNKYQMEAVAHLTCVNSTKENVKTILKQFQENKIENILALRGDINPDIPPKNEFCYASELVSFIKENGDFFISGGCYPEGHPECDSMIEDLQHLKQKVDAGTEHLISQLFFENTCFYEFIEKVRIAGIQVPIEAGIMPVVNKSQIERMVTMCGASLPKKFSRMMQRYEHNPEALRDAGIAYATDQIIDLLSNGVDGIHLYTMNNPYVARKITQNIKQLI